MKLELADLMKAVEKVPKPVEVTTSPGIPFIEEVGKNVKSSMDILESIGLKDLFVAKAQQEIRKRFKWGEDDQAKGSKDKVTAISIPKSETGANYDQLIGLGIVWLRSFIQKNGDVKLSEFCEMIEENKSSLVDSIKSITGGMQNNA